MWAADGEDDDGYNRISNCFSQDYAYACFVIAERERITPPNHLIINIIIAWSTIN